MADPRKRVLLFAGHMIDARDRQRPRFPADREAVARAKIRETVEEEMANGAGVACAYAGGASGGDILFHEVCAELGVETRLYLAFPPEQYVVASVEKAGGQWVERFWKLYHAHAARGLVRVLSEEEDVKRDDIWQRNNLWMLSAALEEARDPGSEDPNLTLIALWDGEAGDGAGGTGHLIEKARARGARVVILDTKSLFNL